MSSAHPCRITDVRVVAKSDGQGGTIPDRVADPINFEVTLDVAEPLSEDVVFKSIFIMDNKDVVLDEADVGNSPGLQAGILRFNFESDPPLQSQIEQAGGPKEVTGLYISAFYKDAEFCRLGYYIRFEYEDPELEENPPKRVQWNQLARVLSPPCVTEFRIKWDEQATRAPEDGMQVTMDVDGVQVPIEGGPDREVLGAADDDYM
eukprot:TRINITY_DN95458_c0_g1_i1.p1 TRINITY_DN95458_c0_g1~~TRINITY_DN95458_c0_g1_i1.p1  ORF type:complete len:217 (+),score=34.21 TRINITY_DN95458_c0_g1_i1:37-651(+)